MDGAERQTTGIKISRFWSAQILIRRMRSTNSKCGKPIRSIRRELISNSAGAEKIGMNTMRVYLHDLLWKQDSVGFTKRLNEFLTIADKHKIKPVFVIFDSCWDPYPALGRQREPRPGIHNSGWVQSPGAVALTDPAQYPRLETYVKGLGRRVQKRQTNFGVGRLERTGQYERQFLRFERNRSTRSNSSTNFCRRLLRGRVRQIRRSH